MLRNLTPPRDIVFVKLPPYTEQLIRHDGVLGVNTLNEVKYHPTKGEVIALSPLLKNFPVQIGDTVYFEKLHWQAAKDAAFDSTDERDKGIYFEQEVYAFRENGVYYMAIPYHYLYIAHSEAKGIIKFLNDYTLCAPVAKKDKSGLQIADLREDSYELNQVYLLPGEQIAFTLPHCDIPLEESINQVEFPKEQFIVESENIIAYLMDKRYIAAPNRIIIEVIESETSSDDILPIDSEFNKWQTAKVISAGDNVTCKEGDTIVFPRNAGKRNRLPLLDGSVTQYEVIGKDDYFAIVEEK